jgi:uncharacterized protein (DUF952 family)
MDPADAELLHITSAAAWEAAKVAGRYAPASLSTEGFIHLSTARQLPGTARRFFAGQRDLVVLTVAAAALEPGALRWEDPGEGQAFPHLYRPLGVDEVRAVRSLEAALEASERSA